uniref:Transposase n=1 Tax=Heterorhabditis bacteriophora TaxID=37862 RepID=A0A1I7WM37_HETBA
MAYCSSRNKAERTTEHYESTTDRTIAIAIQTYDL